MTGYRLAFRMTCIHGGGNLKILLAEDGLSELRLWWFLLPHFEHRSHSHYVYILSFCVLLLSFIPIYPSFVRNAALHCKIEYQK